MKAELNSNVFKIVDVGMYESYISPENIFNDYNLNDDNEEGYICYNSEFFDMYFDNKKYHETVREAVIQFLENNKEELKPILSNIKVGDIYSPKYYNFATDNIELTVTYNKQKLINLVQNDLNFGEFLKENYSSYSGFTSFTSNNYYDWLNSYNKDEEQEIGAVLSYLLKDIDIEDFQNWFTVVEQPYYSEYINKGGDIILNEVEHFISQSISRNSDLDIILSEVNEMLTENSWESYFDCKAYIQKEIREIENNTLKLNL